MQNMHESQNGSTVNSTNNSGSSGKFICVCVCVCVCVCGERTVIKMIINR